MQKNKVGSFLFRLPYRINGLRRLDCRSAAALVFLASGTLHMLFPSLGRPHQIPHHLVGSHPPFWCQQRHQPWKAFPDFSKLDRGSTWSPHGNFNSHPTMPTYLLTCLPSLYCKLPENKEYICFITLSSPFNTVLYQ